MATNWIQPMDPSDRIDFKIDCIGILETGESISSYTVSIPAESQLYGLTLGTAPYQTSISGAEITIWLHVDTLQQNNAIFKTGQVLPVELTINTNSNPPRTRQRTLGVMVQHL